jgi:hypothetical protein
MSPRESRSIIYARYNLLRLINVWLLLYIQNTRDAIMWKGFHCALDECIEVETFHFLVFCRNRERSISVLDFVRRCHIWLSNQCKNSRNRHRNIMKVREIKTTPCVWSWPLKTFLFSYTHGLLREWQKTLSFQCGQYCLENPKFPEYLFLRNPFNICRLIKFYKKHFNWHHRLGQTRKYCYVLLYGIFLKQN